MASAPSTPFDINDWLRNSGNASNPSQPEPEANLPPPPVPNSEQPPSPNSAPPPVLNQELIPAPERHGGVRCEGCGKDDPDKKAFTNYLCGHVVCEDCVTLPSQTDMLSLLELGTDMFCRIFLWDIRCKVCGTERGYLSRYKAPKCRLQPKVSAVPGLFSSSKSAPSMIEVVVGSSTPSKRTFTAHKSILTARSKTFARRLQRMQEKSKSARDTKLKLPNYDPKTFGYVLEFMYTKTIEDKAGTQSMIPSTTQLFDIWALASSLEMDELANYCAWKLLKRYDKGIIYPSQSLAEKYVMKDASHFMKKLIVDIGVWDRTPRSWDKTTPKALLVAHGEGLRKRITDYLTVNPLDTSENYYIPV